MEEYNIEGLMGRAYQEGDSPRTHKQLQLINKYYHPGIYYMSIDNKVIYVGQSKNMYSRVFSHKREAMKEEPKEKKYKMLKEAIEQGRRVQFGVLYYAPYYDKPMLSEREAYFLNYYLPPLNTSFPAHKDFEKHSPIIKELNTLEEILENARELEEEAEVPDVKLDGTELAQVSSALGDLKFITSPEDFYRYWFSK